MFDVTNRRSRQFPFAAGTGFRNSDWEKALQSLRFFKVVWEAVKADKLQIDDIRYAFGKSTSDAISYRESWKCGQFWSVAAWEKACENKTTAYLDLICEHVLPREEMMQHLFHSADINTVDKAAAYLWENSFVCVITKQENSRLTRAGYAKNGFVDDPWLRYSAKTLEEPILVLDAECPPGTPLMSASERAKLQGLGLLQHKSVLSPQFQNAPPLI